MASDICYPPGADWSCAYDETEFADLDPVIVERSESLAWLTLQMLTGYRLSICPTVIRPCLAKCGGLPTWDIAPVTGNWGFSPFISGGRWYNACGCSRDDCSCTSLCEVILPAEAGDIESVMLGGVALDPSAYRVDNGNRLLRTDGDCWPSCQDMNAPDQPQYEPVTISNPTNTLTVTREGQIVQVFAEPTALMQGGGFAGNLPWTPTGSSQTSVFNASGGSSGMFVINEGSKALNGSAGPGFAPFRVVYETSDAPAPNDAEGSFIVSYFSGVAPNDLFRYAAGVLASEFYLACNGKDCRLPSGVSSLSRSGVTMQIDTGFFPDNSTGIAEVDAVVRIYNPFGLRQKSKVLSPDRPRGRTQTWG